MKQEEPKFLVLNPPEPNDEEKPLYAIVTYDFIPEEMTPEHISPILVHANSEEEVVSYLIEQRGVEEDDIVAVFPLDEKD